MARVLLWDHDGVLVDTERLYFQATREVLATVGVDLDESLYRQLFLVEGGGAWHLARAQGVSQAELAELKERRNARYTALLTAENVLIPGALAMLDELASKHRMAIVTSSRRMHFEAIHRHSGLPSRFELVLVREDYERSKPDPEPYRTALTRLGVDADACLVIEDSERGLSAAKAAGLECWVIPSSLTSQSDFSRADRRFDQLASLRAALLALCSP